MISNSKRFRWISTLKIHFLTFAWAWLILMIVYVEEWEPGLGDIQLACSENVQSEKFCHSGKYGGRQPHAVMTPLYAHSCRHFSLKQNILCSKSKWHWKTSSILYRYETQAWLHHNRLVDIDGCADTKQLALICPVTLLYFAYSDFKMKYSMISIISPSLNRLILQIVLRNHDIFICVAIKKCHPIDKL